MHPPFKKQGVIIDEELIKLTEINNKTRILLELTVNKIKCCCPDPGFDTYSCNSSCLGGRIKKFLKETEK